MHPIENLTRAAARWPGRTAAVAGGERLAYGELGARVGALASAFLALDPAPGGRVGLCAHNTADHLVAMLAVLAAGKTWVALNPRNAPAELDGLLAATRPGIVVADEDCLSCFSKPEARLIVGRGGGPAPADTLAGLAARHAGRDPGPPSVDPASAIAVKMTGGSTSKPKAVVQSVRCWNVQVASQRLALGLGPDDVTLLAAPITHGTGHYILPTFAAGGRVELLARPRPAQVLEAFAAGATTTFLPPTLIYGLMAEPGAADRAYPALRHLIYAGAPMRLDAIARARAMFNGALETSYGQAEAPQVMAFQAAADFADEANHGAVGFPTAFTRLAVMDGEGRLLPAGETGEIVARGDLVFSGYLDDPEATAAVMSEGWLRTGDLGAFDAAGRLFIKGRSRDVIITGGFNVYPADVEAALGRHPAVHECVVFAVEDEKWGERVEAAVELHAGAAATPAELIAFAKGALGSVKAPKAIHLAASLPRSAVGKVVRREAKAMFHPTGG